MDQVAKEPTRAQLMGQALALFLRNEQPMLRNQTLVVIYRPRCPFIYAAHRGKAGVVVVTGLKFNSPRFASVLSRAAKSALEVAQGLTHAIEVREPVEEES